MPAILMLTKENWPKWLLAKMALAKMALAEMAIGRNGIGQSGSWPKWHWAKWLLAKLGIGPSGVGVERSALFMKSGSLPLNIYVKSEVKVILFMTPRG